MRPSCARLVLIRLKRFGFLCCTDRTTFFKYAHSKVFATKRATAHNAQRGLHAGEVRIHVATHCLHIFFASGDMLETYGARQQTAVVLSHHPRIAFHFLHNLGIGGMYYRGWCLIKRFLRDLVVHRFGVGLVRIWHDMPISFSFEIQFVCWSKKKVAQAKCWHVD
jgi:hypothetical protein